MKKYIWILISLLIVVAVIVSCDSLFAQGLMGSGVTNLTNLELAGTLDVAGNTDLVGTLNYGANNLYVIGHDTSGEQFIYGTESITGTAEVAHGLTTVTYALCTMAEDPTVGAGEGATCSLTISTNTVTVKVWQDDNVTAATETEVDVNYFIIGTP